MLFLQKKRGFPQKVILTFIGLLCISPQVDFRSWAQVGGWKYKNCYVLSPFPICRPYRLCFYTYLSFCSQGVWFPGPGLRGCLPRGVSRPRPRPRGVSRPRPMGCIPACTEADPLPNCRILLRTVRIPLECILVLGKKFNKPFQENI